MKMTSELEQFLTGRLFTAEVYTVIFTISFIAALVLTW